MIHLIDLRDGAARPRLSPGHGLDEWHRMIVTEITAGLTPAHAALFAIPRRTEAGTAWYAPGSALRRFTDLPGEDRRALTVAAGAILSDIRRLAESGRTHALAVAWPALREIPDLGHLFAVNGRPVLAGWGHSPSSGGVGPMVALDDGVPWRPLPRRPWRLYAVTLAVLAGVALAVGLLLPQVGGIMFPLPGACRAVPAQLALLAEETREADRSTQLRSELAALQQRYGEKVLNCPIPRIEVAPPPRPATPAALPQNSWDQHDLGMLKGCWNRYTNMTTHDEAPPFTQRPVAMWTMCFDEHGGGHQKVVWSDGANCENDLRASFRSDGGLDIADRQQCLGSRPLFLGRYVCTRTNDDEAACPRTEINGPAPGNTSFGNFRR